ncbi:neurofascin-like isoform X2 [Parasteatoda tepidariorum]|uniref:neurofascin-like isoform X2 n=1 Tax=Parasteatoda tepidariorum TaxID=114398 RepID=UPI001C720A51|nr:Down syndrome cell adhesion molecule-like protein Dscam2 isoform X2 [Parasteatoda tepidariorum]
MMKQKYLCSVCFFLVFVCRAVNCKEPPKIIPMNFAQMIYVGGKASVPCLVSGGTTPIKFSWFKNHKDVIHDSSKIEVSNLKDASILTIEPVSLDDAGNYSCTARNSFGNDTASATLVVEAPLRWLKEPFDVEVAEGSEAHLVCVVSGSPQPHYTWTKIEDYNHEKTIIINSVDGDLVFRETKISDAGTYTCRVQNGVGEPLEKSVKVVVHGYL